MVRQVTASDTSEIDDPPTSFQNAVEEVGRTMARQGIGPIMMADYGATAPILSDIMDVNTGTYIEEEVVEEKKKEEEWEGSVELSDHSGSASEYYSHLGRTIPAETLHYWDVYDKIQEGKLEGTKVLSWFNHSNCDKTIIKGWVDSSVQYFGYNDFRFSTHADGYYRSGQYSLSYVEEGVVEEQGIKHNGFWHSKVHGRNGWNLHNEMVGSLKVAKDEKDNAVYCRAGSSTLEIFTVTSKEVKNGSLVIHNENHGELYPSHLAVRIFENNDGAKRFIAAHKKRLKMLKKRTDDMIKGFPKVGSYVKLKDGIDISKYNSIMSFTSLQERGAFKVYHYEWPMILDEIESCACLLDNSTGLRCPVEYLEEVTEEEYKKIKSREVIRRMALAIQQNMRRELVGEDDNVGRLSSKLIAAIRSRSVLMKKIREGCIDSVDDMLNSVNKQVEKMNKKHSLIKKAVIDMQTLELDVRTENLFIKRAIFAGDETDIEEYQEHLPIKIGMYDIKVKLLSGNIYINKHSDLRHINYEIVHPHCGDYEGWSGICLGNTQVNVSKAFAQFDPTIIVDTVLEILQMYREGDAYSSLNEFVRGL